MLNEGKIGYQAIYMTLKPVEILHTIYAFLNTERKFINITAEISFVLPRGMMDFHSFFRFVSNKHTRYFYIRKKKPTYFKTSLP